MVNGNCSAWKLETWSCQLSPLSDFVKAQSFSVMFREWWHIALPSSIAHPFWKRVHDIMIQSLDITWEGLNWKDAKIEDLSPLHLTSMQYTYRVPGMILRTWWRKVKCHKCIATLNIERSTLKNTVWILELLPTHVCVYLQSSRERKREREREIGAVLGDTERAMSDEF